MRTWVGEGRGGDVCLYTWGFWFVHGTLCKFKEMKKDILAETNFFPPLNAVASTHPSKTIGSVWVPSVFDVDI